MMIIWTLFRKIIIHGDEDCGLIHVTEAYQSQSTLIH